MKFSNKRKQNKIQHVFSRQSACDVSYDDDVKTVVLDNLDAHVQCLN